MKKHSLFRMQVLFIFLLLLISSITVATYPENDVTKQQPTNIFSTKTVEADILSPRSSMPVMAEANTSITITFSAPEFDHVLAYITTAYEDVIDERWLQTESLTNTDESYTLIATIPADTPPELYNLTLLFYNDGDFTHTSRPRAVSVKEEIGDSFTFIHITDFHAGDPRGFVEDIYETLKQRSIKKCIEEINLLNPDFVLISGDLVFGQLYPFEYQREYPLCYDLIQRFDVPTYLAPGNHDGYYRFREDGLKFWEEYFGPLNYSFNYGDYHFQAINSYDFPAWKRAAILFVAIGWGGSISDSQLDWIETDLQENQDATLTFQFMHHNPILDTIQDSLLRFKYQNREELLGLIDDYDVDMVLGGHVHIDNVYYENDTIFLTTTTPESEIRFDDGYWGYRLVTITNKSITNYNYKEPKYSTPSYRLNHTTWQHNDLAFATFTNDLDVPIPVHTQFTMPKGEYHAINAEITQIRTGLSANEVYLRTIVAPHSIKSLQVYTIH